MQVKSIMHSSLVHIIPGNTTIQDAAIKMTELNIGALLVGKPEKLEGIFSERDILKKVVNFSLPIDKTFVKDVMSKNVVTIPDTEVVEIALSLMQENKFRHLPVVDKNGICIGVLGIRDLMKSVSEVIEKENKALARYVTEDNTWN